MFQFCCSFFEWHVYDAGRKGFSIIPQVCNNQYQFIFQGRNQDENGKTETERIIESQVIRFCPFCGCNLEELIKRNKEAIVELVEKYKDLSPLSIE
jgi:hypothetical protein